MDRHHDPVELCELLGDHYRAIGLALDELETLSTAVHTFEPESLRPRIQELKGNIVSEANKILSLLSP